MPKPDKQIIIDSIIKGIELGKDRGKLLSTFVKKWQISQRTFDRHWKTANQQHVAKQAVIKKELAALDTQAALDARKKAIMSAEERKEWLTSVINGTLKVNRKPAPFAERRNALAELNKMDGDYADVAFRIKGDKENPLYTSPNLSDTQFQQLLTAARESKTNSGQ